VGPPGPFFFDLEAGYWAERKRSNILLVHYDDLSNDLETEMRRIADFLEIEIGEDLWPSLVQAARFAAMQAAGDELMPQTRAMFAEGSKRFFNKGVNGRWRAVLTDEDLALYDAKVRECLSRGLGGLARRGPAPSG
jgi:aryl sulfotransferase